MEPWTEKLVNRVMANLEETKTDSDLHQKHFEMLLRSKYPHTPLPEDKKNEEGLLQNGDLKIIARIPIPPPIQALRYELKNLYGLDILYRFHPVKYKEDRATKDELYLIVAPVRAHIAKWVEEEGLKIEKIRALKRNKTCVYFEFGANWKMLLCVKRIL